MSLLLSIGTIVIVLGMLGAAVWMIVLAVEEGRKLEAEHKRQAPERAAKLEDDIDDILAQHRQGRRLRRARDKSAWDEWYFLSLPVEEHPEYFELNLATDNVDSFTQKSADGMVCAQFEFRSNSRGQSYNLEIDHVTQMAKVSTGKISWEVPLRRVDNWKQLT